MLHPTLRSLANAALLTICYIAGFAIFANVTFSVVNARVENGYYRYPSNGHDPFAFPVVVVTPDKKLGHRAVITRFEILADYCSKLPDYSFTIPAGKKGELNAQVAKQTATEQLLPPGRFEVKQLPNGRQSLRVVSSFDTDERGGYIYVSWYEAGKHDVKPLYHSWNREWNTFACYIMPGLVLYSIAWIVGRRAYRRRKNASHQADLI